MGSTQGQKGECYGKGHSVANRGVPQRFLQDKP